MAYKDEITRRKARRESYRRRGDKIRAQERKYQAENPERYRQRKLKSRYGLTHEGYQKLYRDQGGLCALCLERPISDIDHDHETGVVRALLCRACNIGLGMFCDSIDRLSDAIAYLTKHGKMKG